MMVLKQDQQRVKTLIKDTITLLCKNGLSFSSEFSIEALIGITLDKDDVFLMNINEIVKTDIETPVEELAEDVLEVYSDTAQSGKRTRKRRRVMKHKDGQIKDAASSNNHAGNLSDEQSNNENFDGNSDLDQMNLDESEKVNDNIQYKIEVQGNEGVIQVPKRKKRTPSNTVLSTGDRVDTVYIKQEVEESTEWSDMQQQDQTGTGDDSMSQAVFPDFLSEPGLSGGLIDPNMTEGNDPWQAGPSGMFSTSPRHRSPKTSRATAESFPEDAQQSLDQYQSSTTTIIELEIVRKQPENDAERKETVVQVVEIGADEEAIKIEEVTTAEQEVQVFKCKFCSYRTTDRGTFSLHRRGHVKNRVKCKLCDHTSTSIYILNQHVKNQHGEGIICDICGKVYMSQSGIKYHKRQMHSVGKSSDCFKCTHCDKIFVRRDQLDGHMNTHLNKKPYKCCNSGCSRTFAFKGNLTTHIAKCSGFLKVTCSICSKVFVDKKNLVDHMAGKHSDKSFVCQCGKSYAWRGSFWRHVQKCQV